MPIRRRLVIRDIDDLFISSNPLLDKRNDCRHLVRVVLFRRRGTGDRRCEHFAVVLLAQIPPPFTSHTSVRRLAGMCDPEVYKYTVCGVNDACVITGAQLKQNLLDERAMYQRT